ncbi:MAG: hypothetical protein DCC68_12365 [Planctomycetota bacterium]|nr:MAG: hypothetical protein DCC68_12365 [Planctomycetota bacterium]
MIVLPDDTRNGGLRCDPGRDGVALLVEGNDAVATNVRRKPLRGEDRTEVVNSPPEQKLAELG